MKLNDTIAFEDARREWGHIADSFVYALKHDIKSLLDAEFTYEKAHVRVCDKEPDGRKKRCGQGPYYLSRIAVSGEDAENAWKAFCQIVEKNALSPAERFSNNEEGLGRYHFESNDAETGDRLKCEIELPGEWNGDGYISFSVFIGARFRAADIVQET